MTVTAGEGTAAGETPDREAAARVPDVVRRRLAPWEPGRDPWSWAVAGAVTLVAAIVRLTRLERPAQIMFDETYYAPNAYALLRHGVEWQVAEGGSNPVNGAPVLGDGPAYVVHPPLGKWMIALGEWVFGYSPFGWRVAAAVAGILSVLMVVRIGRRLFRSTVLGAAAGLLVALDGMHVVMSRVALLDIFLLFFLVAAFGAVLLDRDARRGRWLCALEKGLDPARGGPAGRPRTGPPWWRYAAAALLGCAVAVKWSAVFFIPVFLILVVVWEVGTRRSAGVRHPWRDTVLDEGPSVLVSAVIAPVVYLLSWTGWLVTDHGYFRNWLADNGHDQPPVLGPLWNLWHYHLQAFGFHSGLDESHQYESSPWQWLLLGRPVAFHWSTEDGCGAAECTSEVLLLGTPLLWWSFLAAVAVALWLGVARRDWRVPPLLLPAAAGIVPWFFFPDRVMFYFYALPSQPFLVLTVVYVLGALMTPARAGPGGGPPPPAGPAAGSPAVAGSPAAGLGRSGVDRRTLGVVIAGAYVLLVALNYAYFHPIFTGIPIPEGDWQARMWLGGLWI